MTGSCGCTQVPAASPACPHPAPAPLSPARSGSCPVALPTPHTPLPTAARTALSDHTRLRHCPALNHAGALLLPGSTSESSHGRRTVPDLTATSSHSYGPFLPPVPGSATRTSLVPRWCPRLLADGRPSRPQASAQIAEPRQTPGKDPSPGPLPHPPSPRLTLSEISLVLLGVLLSGSQQGCKPRGAGLFCHCRCCSLLHPLCPAGCQAHSGCPRDTR